MNLAPAGGVRALQIHVFSRREIGRYEAAEMREVCRGGGHECVAEAELDTSLYVWSGRVIAFIILRTGDSHTQPDMFSP